MNGKVVLAAAGFFMAALAVLCVSYLVNRDRDSQIPVSDAAEQLKKQLGDKDDEISALRRKLDSAEAENRALRLKAGPGEGGMTLIEGESAENPADGSGPAEAGNVAVAGKPAEGAVAVAAPSYWDSLSSKMISMLWALGGMDPDQAKKLQDDPRLQADAVKMIGQLMTEIGEAQAKLGLDDSGFVTESPAFKARVVKGILDKMGKPLSTAEVLDLYRKSEDAMTPYLAAAKGEPGDFALDRMRRTAKCVDTFNEEMDRIAGDRLAGLPMVGKTKNSASPDDTWWPDQSTTGVKDVEGAVQSLKKKWQTGMGIPDGESAGLEQVVREYVDRTRVAESRYGSGDGKKLTAAERKALDFEIAGFESAALRRIHDTLNVDDKTREKVRNYRSLDRFEIGSTRSWSRSGSFGGFRMSAGSSSSEEKEGE